LRRLSGSVRGCLKTTYLDRDPVVGEKRPSPGDASPPRQPRIRLVPKRKVNESKKKESA
jgi:hypothetical protein